MIDAKSLGYEVRPASAIEVGLLKNGKGVRTWWVADFGGEMPTLEHPIIQKAIEIEETYDIKLKAVDPYDYKPPIK